MIRHTVFIALASSRSFPTSPPCQLPQPSSRQVETRLRNQRHTPTAFLSVVPENSGPEVRLRAVAFRLGCPFPAPLAHCRVSWSRLRSLHEAKRDRAWTRFAIRMSPAGKNGPLRRWRRIFVAFADQLVAAARCPKVLFSSATPARARNHFLHSRTSPGA